MPSLIDIRRRIRSVKNTQQITKAMKMVSAAKLRRAQERALSARPYNEILNDVLKSVAQAVEDDEEIGQRPLLQRREEKRIAIVAVTSDRGLAGAFNANLLRMMQRFLDEHSSAELSFEVVGRKGRDYLRRRSYRIEGEYIGIIEKPSFAEAAEIANKLIERYTKADIDAVYIVFNEFKSIMTPNLVLQRVLPVTLPGTEESDKALPDRSDEKRDEVKLYIYEQPPQELLAELLPRYVQMQVFRALLESNSAEQGARMAAMDAASSNASTVIDDLTLNLNRVRQAAITREIIEIVSGASAL